MHHEYFISLHKCVCNAVFTQMSSENCYRFFLKLVMSYSVYCTIFPVIPEQEEQHSHHHASSIADKLFAYDLA